MEYLTLTWWDYLLFSVVLGISLAMGIYHGFCKKQVAIESYSFGRQDLKVVPVGLSLAATLFSGSNVLLLPAEIYLYGTGICSITLTLIPVALVMRYVYLPVFHKLKINSLYEYLEIRFDSVTRKFASFLYIVYSMTYLPLSIYGPALCFNQVTGFNTNVVGGIMIFLCTCYTALGGFKAVIWADAFQMVIVFIGLLTTLVMGLISVGGFESVWRRANLGQRLYLFNMDPNLSRRDTFWAAFVGGTFVILMHVGLDPGSSQRILSARSLNDSFRIIIVSVLATAIAYIFIMSCGIVIFARYYDCDPLSANQITKVDQLVPYFILDVGRRIRGLNGMFTAGLFCAGISTASTILNVLPETIYADFLKSVIPETATEAMLVVTLKLLTALIGVLALCLLLVINKFGSIFEVTFIISAVLHGPMLGLFTMGTLFSVINAKGALFGTTSSAAIMGWIVMERKLRNVPPHAPRPFNLSGCSAEMLGNISAAIDNSTRASPEEYGFPLNVCSFYNALFGFIVSIIAGLLVSYMTRTNDSSPVNMDAINPMVYRFIKMPDKTVDDFQNGTEHCLLNDISNKSDRDQIENVSRNDVEN